MFFTKKFLYFGIFKFSSFMLSVLAVLLLGVVLNCTDSDDYLYSYEFPSLSLGQLVDLKKSSESMEGFFMTTNMSDFDESWASRGLYLYTCVRFLNNEGINNKLKKSSIPLLIQINNAKNKPVAEAIVLLHSNTDGVFYHVERRYFNFLSAPIQIGKVKYLIHDVKFNKKGKITDISFVEETVDLKELKELLLEYGEDIYSNYADYAKSTSSNSSEHPFIEATGFAKLFNSSCESWDFINYHHNDTVPSYLKGEQSQTAKDSNGSQPADSNDTPEEASVEEEKEKPADSGTNTVAFSSELPDTEEEIDKTEKIEVDEIEKTEKTAEEAEKVGADEAEIAEEVQEEGEESAKVESNTEVQSEVDSEAKIEVEVDTDSEVKAEDNIEVSKEADSEVKVEQTETTSEDQNE